MEVSQNIALFRELVRCGGDIFTWCYDAQGNLLESNCPEEEFLSSVFSVFGCRDHMMAHWQQSTVPLTLGSGIGLVWSAAFEQRDGQPCRAWVFGPFFYTDVSMKSIENGFRAYSGLEVSVAWKSHLIDLMYKIPTVPHLVNTQYLLMLHYCLTGEHLVPSGLGSVSAIPLPQPDAAPQHDRHKVWGAEQALLQMVRNGVLGYQSGLSTSVMRSSGGQVPARAAVGDAYIQNAEGSRSMDDLKAIPMKMYDDFIHRVHNCRTNPKLSVAVQKCVDYIEMHLTERIRAADLAAMVGYSEYYITRKFREETGYSFSDYVIFAKTERAKVLLRSSDRSVQEIAAELGFATRSHFSRNFHKVTGKTPAQFRAGVQG